MEQVLDRNSLREEWRSFGFGRVERRFNMSLQVSPCQIQCEPRSGATENGWSRARPCGPGQLPMEDELRQKWETVRRSWAQPKELDSNLHTPYGTSGCIIARREIDSTDGRGAEERLWPASTILWKVMRNFRLSSRELGRRDQGSSAAGKRDE